jgi:error-prone DNA polymerase
MSILVPTSPPSYAALWCKSNFSFLEGASHPEELVETAHRLGISALALTDRDGVYGIVRAFVKARELGVHLITGSQVTVDNELPENGEANSSRLKTALVLLAEDRAGYANLCQLLTAGRLRSKKGECAVSLREVCERAPGLLALAGPAHTDGTPTVIDASGPDTLATLKDAFGDRLYVLAARHLRAEEIDEERRLRAHAGALGLPLVAGNEVLYHSPARRPLQDVLTCIRHGVTVFTAGRLLRPNAEHDLKSPHALSQRFADDPLAVARTLEVAGRCTFSLAELRYRYPSERLPNGLTTATWLRQLTMEGALKRYGGELPAAVATQLEKELSLVEELDYCGYFLTMREVVEFCRHKRILCQGRGSAANSAVCYCLGITAVDPVRMGLLFERFLSRERAEPPDIDLDIEHERREEVIQHVYQKYGRTHAAMVANVIRYRARSAVRDVGKALGLPETGLDRMARLLDLYDGLDAGALDHSGMDPERAQHLLRLASEIQEFPRHLSIHPGGFLLGHDPVPTLVPVENGTMDDRTVIQWDKDDVEAVGLFKVDLLGLGALTHLHRTFDLIAKHRDETLSMATLPSADEATFDAICAADTVGVFQIESRAQMSMLPRLRPRNYYDLVIEVSIVRPGPITGGMVHPYLRRRNQEEAIEYPHECLRPVLEKTLGVPLFQEQVMKLAMVAADYTPGEADQLRRDMAAWRKSGRLEQHKERLVSRMEQKGIAREFAERVFKQICGFGEYGFPESHAASFALISYAGSYLKRHYPTEFTCGLLNSLPMGFYSPSTIVEDARRHGVVIRPIDVLHSRWDCTIEPVGESAGEGLALRMGLRFVKGLGEAEWLAAEAALAVGETPTTPRTLEALVRRTHLSEKALTALAEAGAFDGLAPHRRQALWQAQGLSRSRPTPLSVDVEELPELDPLTTLETINWDYRRSSHSAHGHPLEPLRQELTAQGLPDAQAVARRKDGERIRYAGLVICRQHPGTAAGVTFMTLEDETGFVNLVLWKQVFAEYGLLAKTASFLGVTGRLQVQDNVVHLIAEKLWRPQLTRVPASGGSRDFH